MSYQSNFAALIQEICQEENIRLISLSDGWAFHMEKDGRSAFLYGYQFAQNSASSASVCTDKSTASEWLRQKKIPCIPHTCLMNPDPMEYAPPSGSGPILRSMLQQYGSIVLKDNTGTGGDLVFRASTPREAEYAASKIFQKSPSLAVCPYQDIQEEYRVILLRENIRLIYRKLRPSLTGDGHSSIKELYAAYLSSGNEKELYTALLTPKELARVPQKGERFPLNWKHNLGQGAKAQILFPAWEDQEHPLSSKQSLLLELTELAQKAAKALEITFASIDLVLTNDGLQVLEVNSGVMMEYLAQGHPSHRALAKEIYREALLDLL